MAELGLVSALTNLCTVLDCLVKSSFKPDFFRLSKLNQLKLEQIQQFWDLIHKLCCFSGTEKPCPGDFHKCIEHYLRTQGGVAAYFLSSNATARQLLLCFGFILGGRVIECIIDRVLLGTPLGEEIPSFMAESDREDAVEILTRPDGDPQALLNYVLTVSGMIKHNLRAVANYRQEKAQLLSKIHTATAGSSVSRSHLSAGALLMAVRPELQNEFLSQSQHCVPLLHSYSKWIKKSPIFWKWMLTVIDEEFKMKPKQHCVEEITHMHEFLRRLKSDVEKEQKNEINSISKDTAVPVSERRMCPSENNDNLDIVIDSMKLKINSLKLGNETLIKQIKTSNQNILIDSILQTLCD